MSQNEPKSDRKKRPNHRSNWDALFLKKTEQAAFSTLWVTIVLGCAWYFFSARSFDLIDIDQAKVRPTRFLVEVNSANKHEFDCLPGIGPKTAASITQWRQQNGPFESIDGLVAVPGVSEKLLQKVRSYLYLEPSNEVTQK